MGFTSQAFFLFLPLVLLVYHLLPRRNLKYGFLLLASWGFYLSFTPRLIWVIVLTSAIDYAAGLFIEAAGTLARRRAWLTLSIVANLGLLAFFKYSSFFVSNSLCLARALGWTVPDWTVEVLLPLGISFHTFQGISYTLDVYQGKIRAVHRFVDFALFVAFFP